jgi:hypothetical protein
MVPTWTDNVDRICLDGQWLLEAGADSGNRRAGRRMRLTRTFLAEN